MTRCSRYHALSLYLFDICSAVAVDNGACDKGIVDDVDINFLLDLVYGAIWYRVLVQHAALDEVLMEQLVDMLRRYNPA